MSQTVTLVLIAVSAFIVFLLLALVLWSIRIRRAEDGFEPAPTDRQKNRSTVYDPFAPAEAPAEDMQSLTQEIPDIPISSAQPPTDEETESPLKSLLRSAMPELSTMIELGKMVKDSQAAGETPNSPEERNAAFQRALDKMLEEQPDNSFLRQLRTSMPSADASSAATAEDDRVQVFQVGGKTAIRVDGVEISSADDIPDPEIREKVRRLIDALNLGEAFQQHFP